MFWKKKKKQQEPESKTILGMLLLADTVSFDLSRLAADQLERFSRQLSYEGSADNKTAVFEVEGEMVALAHLPVPLPAGELDQSTNYAYYWPEAGEETKGHESHIIVTIMKGSNDMVKRYKLYTEIIVSLMTTTNAVAMYMGMQSLVIGKESYLMQAAYMDDDNLPLNLWIYFGLRSDAGLNSAYTYGLKEFGKKELEIVRSSRSLEDLLEFLFNIAHYVLACDVTFDDGQTCGLSEEERIPISVSKGVYLDEKETFKLAF
jgi:hypothetical protein